MRGGFRKQVSPAVTYVTLPNGKVRVIPLQRETAPGSGIWNDIPLSYVESMKEVAREAAEALSELGIDL